MLHLVGTIAARRSAALESFLKTTRGWAPRVKELKEGGIARLSSSPLRPGLLLLKVNGTTVTSHELGSRLLREASGTVTLDVVEPPGAPSQFVGAVTYVHHKNAFAVVDEGKDATFVPMSLLKPLLKSVAIA